MSEQQPTPMVVVHPDDVNLADTKAVAAQYDATVIGNRYTPRGKMFIIRLPNIPVEPDDA